MLDLFADASGKQSGSVAMAEAEPASTLEKKTHIEQTNAHFKIGARSTRLSRKLSNFGVGAVLRSFECGFETGSNDFAASR